MLQGTSCGLNPFWPAVFSWKWWSATGKRYTQLQLLNASFYRTHKPEWLLFLPRASVGLHNWQLHPEACKQASSVAISGLVIRLSCQTEELIGIRGLLNLNICEWGSVQGEDWRSPWRSLRHCSRAFSEEYNVNSIPVFSSMSSVFNCLLALLIENPKDYIRQ